MRHRISQGGSVAQEFIIEVGRLLHRYGAPALRIESTLGDVSRSLGLGATFLVTPTSLMFEFTGTPVRLVRTSQGAVDLGGLTQVYEAAGRVVRGECTPTEGLLELAAVDASSRPYSGITMVGATVASSAAAACFLASTWLEVAISAAAGVFVGLLTELGRRSPDLDRALPTLAAAIVTFFAAAIGVVEPVSVYAVTVCALIMFVPGLTLTTAMAEVSTGHLVAGTSRLASAVVVLLAMGVGVALGASAASAFLGPATIQGPEATLGDGAVVLGLMMGAASFQVLLLAERQDFVWVLASGLVAGIGLLLPLPEYAAVFVGAFGIGLYGRLYVAVMDRPAPVVVVPAILVLVPGSIGFQSVSLLMSDDVLSGTAGLFRMSITGAAIALGLVMSGALDAGNRPGAKRARRLRRLATARVLRVR